jgi:hypothetical protein
MKVGKRSTVTKESQLQDVIQTTDRDEIARLKYTRG